MSRYYVRAWHGTAGSIAYVIDGWADEPEQPAVIESYMTWRDGPTFRELADEHARMLNAKAVA